MSNDSVSVLMSQLSSLHLDRVLRPNNAGVWSHDRKQLEQKKLKAIAFETVFRYLQDHSVAKLVFFCC